MKLAQLHEMAARSHQDVVDDVYVTIKKKPDGIMVYYSDQTGRPLRGRNGPSGEVLITQEDDCKPFWQIFSSEAAPGWGPLLYDVAMEVASNLGRGLTSDRFEVSDDAHGVWDYYSSRRPDVQKLPLPPSCSRDVVTATGRQRPALGYGYRKGNNSIRKLLGAGRLLDMIGIT